TQHVAIDRRASLLLDAQREYFNTIRLGDARWGTAAGYRIGSMYDGLWQALMTAPIPPPSRTLPQGTLPIYQREYRASLARHIRPLMRHAIRYWELTLLMAERTGAHTEWAERTRAELEQMRSRLLEDEASEVQESSAPTTTPEPPVPHALLGPSE